MVKGAAAIGAMWKSWLRENAEIEFANANFVSTSINLKNKRLSAWCLSIPNSCRLDFSTT
jgi:hypothetical protein